MATGEPVMHIEKDDSWVDTSVVVFLCGGFCTLGRPDSAIQQDGVDFVSRTNPGKATCSRCLDQSLRLSCAKIREKHNA